MKKNIAVFASGNGTNFQALIDAIQGKELDAAICGLIAGKEGIGAIQRAEKAGIPVKVIKKNNDGTDKGHTSEMLRQLRAWNTDFIALAGYLQKVPDEVIREFDRRILNIHPSLLPKYGGKGFYGMRVYQAVIDAGETESGCSVHVVTSDYDEGPVIAQKKVPVRTTDSPESLAERILKEEHRLYPAAIRNYINSFH